MSPDLPFIPCGSTRFDHGDQLRFAALSGDYNPMHVDPIAARRLVAGRQVVHGMHVLLRAIESMPQCPADLPASIAVDFVNPVCVGDEVAFDEQVNGADRTLRVSSDNHPCTYVEIVAASSPGGVQAAPITADSDLERPDLPLDHEPASWVGRCHRLALPEADMAAAFPRASRWLGEQRVAALGLLSYWVGMVCPGLNSVFTAVTFSPAEPADGIQHLRFKVTRFDPRYRIFLIDFDGCIRGRLKAFLRAAPQLQPAIGALTALVQPGEFAGTHTWVIGGSRGLGELTAKLIAAGGGDVTLTYAMGQADAERVAQDINSLGRGRAETRQLNVNEDNLAAWVASASQSPSAVFYYATPRIFVRGAPGFDLNLLDLFNRIYLLRFHELCAELSARLGTTAKARVFFPSSVAVTELPRNLLEYAMSKAAGELLVESWNRSSATIQITSARLPRLATDQTATVHAVEHEDNVEVMLPLVRQTLAPLA